MNWLLPRMATAVAAVVIGVLVGRLVGGLSDAVRLGGVIRSEEHTSELQSH